MRRRFTVLVLAAALAACGIESPPQECLSYRPARPGPLSYETVVVKERRSVDVWRRTLREQLLKELDLGSRFMENSEVHYGFGNKLALGRSGEPVLKTDIYIESVGDHALIPAYLWTPRTDRKPPLVVVLLHGHQESEEAAGNRRSSMDAAGLAFAQNGFTVIVPEIRSFGDFQVGLLDHTWHIRRAKGNEFFKEVLLDQLSILSFVHKNYPNAELAVMGHSLGGFIALHLAALRQDIARTVVSGIFLPYACIDSGYHHKCQRTGIAQLAEIADIAGLIAPRMLLVHFSDGERFFTSAAKGAAKEASNLFASLGSPDSFMLETSPGADHTFNSQAALRFLQRRGKAAPP